MKRFSAIILVMCMLLGLLSGCGNTESDDASTLSVALLGPITTLDPAKVTSQSEITLVSQMYENLMRLTSAGVTYGNAKSYTYETTADGTYVYTFHLRNDACWTDGQPIEAQDYVNAWKRLVNPDTASPYASLLDMVVGYEEARQGNTEKLAIKALSKNAFSVELTSPCPYFISSICTHFATVAIRDNYLEEENWSLDSKKTLSNGVYRLMDINEEGAELEAYSKYHDLRTVQTEKIRCYFVEDAQTADSYFQEGKVDVALNCGENETSVLGHSQEVTYLAINQMARGMSNEKVCAAMMSIINRNTLDKFIGDNFSMMTGFVGDYISTTENKNFRQENGAIYTNEEISNEDYEALCTEANVAFYNSGYASKEAIEQLSIVIISTEAVEKQMIAQYLASIWKTKLGLPVTVKILSEENFKKELQENTYSLAIMSQKALYNDASVYLNLFESYTESNYSHYYSNAYDLLLRAAENSSTAEARDAYLEDAERFLIEDGAIVPLYEAVYYYEIREDLTGYFQDGLGIFHFYGTTPNTESIA